MALEVVGRSGGLVVAWNKSLFAKVNQRVGWHVVAVQLARLANGWHIVVVQLARLADGWQWVVSLFMALPLPHFGRSYGRISWRLWKASAGTPYFSAGISTLLWKRQIPQMILEVGIVDPNNSGLAWRQADCKRWARQIVCTHGVARHFPICSLV